MADSTTVQLTEENFDETLKQHSGVMMVDFWAEWCGPCKAIAPALEELARESAGRVTLAKVNVDENHGLAGRYGIRSIPTILFVKAGKVVDQVIGAVPKAKLKEKHVDVEILSGSSIALTQKICCGRVWPATGSWECLAGSYRASGRRCWKPWKY
jgi:thioredoxin 1